MLQNVGVLLDFFVTKTYLADEEWQGRAEEIKARAARRYERRDPEKVKSALLAALKEKQPRSVAEVAKGLGYMTTAGIHKLFPGICKRLQERYRRLRPKVPFGQRFEIDDESVRRALLEALKHECPPSIYALVRDLGHKSSQDIMNRFPDLCDSISDRQKKWKSARKRSIKKTLESTLIEVPPPSITKVGNRLGYNNGTTINVYFPELCAKISARYAKHLVSLRDGMREQLRAALRERTPPTLREVANRIGHDRSYLSTQFRALCRLISRRRARYIKQLSTARARKAKKRIRVVAKRLYFEGTYPSLGRVKAKLSGEVTFDTRELSDVLRGVRQELGLPHRLGMSI